MQNFDYQEVLNEFTNSMTSIRGRRIQKLIKREYSNLANIRLIDHSEEKVGITGEGGNLIKTCFSDGKGKYAIITTFNSESNEAVNDYFDLLHDSLKKIDKIE